MTMHAFIRMQPLNGRKKPIAPVQLVGTVPRDGRPHRIVGTWQCKGQRSYPTYARVWADGRSRDFQVLDQPRGKQLTIDSITLVQELTVLPKRSR